MKNFPTIVPVVAVALIDGSGRVLLQQRAPGRAHAGLWEFPGGKVETGESLTQALCREILEELDLRLDPRELTPLSFAADDRQPHVILLYTCRRWSGEARCLDAAALGWFAADALPQLPLVPLDIPLAAAVAGLLKGAN